MRDLQGIAASILGPKEKSRPEGPGDKLHDEPDEGDIDIGLVTASEEIMDAIKENKATEFARALKAFVEMVDRD